MPKNYGKKLITLFLVLALILSVTTLGCTSNQETDPDQSSDTDQGDDSQENGEDGSDSSYSDLTGKTTYCGTWQGSFSGQGDVEGEWEFTVNFDTGEVTGFFRGDTSGDISGTASDGMIDASGSAALGTVNWSGSFNTDASQISGDWEVTEDMGSGTWQGTEGELKETTNGDTDEGTGEQTGEDVAYWEPYSFSEEVYYKYSFTADGQTGSFTWEVTSVSENQATVETTINVEDQTFTTTFTGDKDELGSEASGTPAGAFIAGGLYNPMVPYFSEGGLKVGNKWSVTTPDESVTIEVVGKEEYSGILSYVGEVRVNGNLVLQTAIAENLGFPTYIVAYDEDTGEKQLEIILEEYRE